MPAEKTTKTPKVKKGLRPADPAPDVVLTTEPPAAPADAPAEVPAILATEPAAEASPSPAPSEPAAEEPPPAPVIVTFARPPIDVEITIRAAVTEGKDLVACRAYFTWSKTTDAPQGLMESQDAVRWLCAQPMPQAEPVPEEPEEVEPVAEGEPPRLRIARTPAAPAAAPVVATITPVPPPRQKVLRAVTIDHAFPLTDDERTAMGAALADTVNELSDMKADHRAKRAAMKELETAIVGDQARLASILHEGHEVRKVKVHVVADYADGVQRTIVDDTGAIIDERPLDPGDRQLGLFARPAVTVAPAEVAPTEGGNVDSGASDPDADPRPDPDEDEDDDDGDEDDE